MSERPESDALASSRSLRHAPASARRYFILDTNILNFAVTSPGGAVIREISAELDRVALKHPSETAFCMMPFQLLEVLGTKLPNIGVAPNLLEDRAAIDVFNQVREEALVAYLALPELAQPSLEARARERRSFLPLEGLALFDVCVLNPCRSNGVAEQIASALAWDYALKVTYPKSIAYDLDRFFLASMLTTASPHTSRFRIAKRLWDRFYARGRGEVPSLQIEAANKAMRLKTSRDFLDCDLIHLACFGWFEHDVVVFTCDPPETVAHRIAVYKGMVLAAANLLEGGTNIALPVIRAGVVACCKASGSISHIFPVQRLPTIV